MTTALPAKNIFDGTTNPTTSTMKTSMGQLRDFLAERIGADAGAGAGNFTTLGASGVTTINLNSSALPAGPTGTTVQIGQADTTTNYAVLDGFGGNPTYITRRAQGTNASKTASTGGSGLGGIGGIGYGATGYSSTYKAAVLFTAGEAWTDSAQGAYIDFQTTANGGTTKGISAQITSTGINNTAIGATTPSTGAFTTLSASGAFTMNGGSQSMYSSGAASTTALYLYGNTTSGATTSFILQKRGDSGTGNYSLPGTGNTELVSIGANLVLAGHSGQNVYLVAGATKVATVTPYGIGLGTGTPSSGTGITFPATQSASSDANTLDDYEEGTWTPTQGAGLTVVGAFSSYGKYTKIGNLVTISGRLVGATSVAVSAGNTVMFGGVPFAAVAGTVGEFGIGSGVNGTYTANIPIVAYTGTSFYAAGTIAATPGILFSVTYFAAS